MVDRIPLGHVMRRILHTFLVVCVLSSTQIAAGALIPLRILPVDTVVADEIDSAELHVIGVSWDIDHDSGTVNAVRVNFSISLPADNEFMIRLYDADNMLIFSREYPAPSQPVPYGQHKLFAFEEDVPIAHIYRIEIILVGDPPDPPDPPTPPGPMGFGGGFAADPPCFFDVDMLGEVTRVYVTCNDSRCVQDYEPEDPSGRQFLDLKQGTQVTHDMEGQFFGSPPRWVRMRISDNPPPLPPGLVALSHVYDITGYTETGEPVSMVLFDRHVGMDLVYDPDDLPEDATGIGIGYWNTATGQWELLPQSVGRVAGVGTATADVTHFSTFAVLATVPVEEPPTRDVVWQPPVEPAAASFTAHGLVVQPDTGQLWGPIRVLTHSGRSATVMVTVTNTGDAPGTCAAELLLDGASAGRQEVNLDKGERTVLSFELRDLQNGLHRVEVAGLTTAFTTYQQVNWWLIIITAAALIIIVAAILRMRARSRVHAGHTD